jgi:hypothetical protein
MSIVVCSGVDPIAAVYVLDGWVVHLNLQRGGVRTFCGQLRPTMVVPASLPPKYNLSVNTVSTIPTRYKLHNPTVSHSATLHLVLMIHT